MAGACLVVRAVVADPADRTAFDDWYHREHLPDAMKAFSACAAWRGWSVTDPSLHSAYYQFETLDRLAEIMDGPDIENLITEFDRCWGDRVTRTREVLAVAETIGKWEGG